MVSFFGGVTCQNLFDVILILQKKAVRAVANTSQGFLTISFLHTGNSISYY